ncbi:MAG: NAD+ synthase [Firmicutes bacterium]|nr:NAD+ synthase [Bacillota bacterium]
MMKVCLAQLNPTVGDLTGNTKMLCRILEENSQADLIVFPELFLTGYPPGDLLLQGGFLEEIDAKVRQIQEFSRLYPKPALIFGLPWRRGGKIFNSAAVLQNGEYLGLQHKRKLTRFRLYDENKYFSQGAVSEPVAVRNGRLGLSLGLELDSGLARVYREKGVSLLVNSAALPFRYKEAERHLLEFQRAAASAKLPGVLVNQAGGNDGLIFSGGSGAVDQEGELRLFLPFFAEDTQLTNSNFLERAELGEGDNAAQVYAALTLGLKDYVRKNGLRTVIIGLSGGLDSALTAVIAREALGAENVWGITMPGPYSSPGSVEDSRSLAENLGIRFDILPISELYASFLKALEKHFHGTEMDTAEENIQARLRGSMLMALSNKFGGLVLTNSNKSELAVGYCTLYGDMSGGLALIGDIYKTMVYELAYYINREEEIIPWETIEKPPSAELRPGQRDDDSLPPYEVLDPILEMYLDQGLSQERIIEQGFPEDTVVWVCQAVDRSEYKRRQAATILRITSPTLGYERQMPLAGKK